MTTRINLPDGSVVNVPEGVPLEQAQAEIERYLAQVEPAQRQPQTMEQARPPQQQRTEVYPGGISDEKQRQAMSIAQALPEYGSRRAPQRPPELRARDQATMTDAELRAAEIAAQNPIGNAGRAIADKWRGATRGAASAIQNKLGEAAAAIGMPSVGAALMQGAENIDASLESRRALEDEERAAADNEARRFAEERARRAGAAQSADQSQTTTTADGQPVMRPATAEDQIARTQTPNMPRSMSVQGAREQQLGAASQAPLSMGQAVPAGQSAQVGKAPPKAVKNAVKSGVDYMEQNMDQVVFGLLRQGKVKEAREFQTFMAERKTLRGMEETNRSYVALHYRDEGLWTKSLAGMVDNLYPDGEFEIDTKGTRFMRDDDGEVVGGIVSIRNKETGEVFEQEYIGMESLMRGVAEVGMPDAAYEYQKTRVEEARTKKIENAKNFTSAYDAAAELLFPDGFADGTTGKAFTPEERQQADTAIREYIASSRPDLPQPPPRSAPAGQPPQSASGVGSSIRSFFGGSTGDKPVPTFGG